MVMALKWWDMHVGMRDEREKLSPSALVLYLRSNLPPAPPKKKTHRLIAADYGSHATPGFEHYPSVSASSVPRDKEEDAGNTSHHEV